MSLLLVATVLLRTTLGVSLLLMAFILLSYLLRLPRRRPTPLVACATAVDAVLPLLAVMAALCAASLFLLAVCASFSVLPSLLTDLSREMA